MNSQEYPNFMKLVIALESVDLLAFLFLLTPVGKSLEVSGPLAETVICL